MKLVPFERLFSCYESAEVGESHSVLEALLLAVDVEEE